MGLASAISRPRLNNPDRQIDLTKELSEMTQNSQMDMRIGLDVLDPWMADEGVGGELEPKLL